MPAPQGVAFSITVDGEEVDVLVEPTLLARRSVDALCKIYHKMIRTTVWDDIAELARADMGAIEKAELKQDYISLLKKSAMPTVSEAIEAMQTPEGMIVALEMNSNLDRVQATRLVNGVSSITDLMKHLFSVLASESEEAGN